MKSFKKVFGLLMAIVMLVGTLAACSSNPATNPAQSAGTDNAATNPKAVGEAEPVEFTMALASNLYTMNIGQADSYGEFQCFPLLYDKLIRRMPDGSYVGRLVKDWEFSEDYLACTFTLQEGVKFQNGEDWNSEAIKATFDYIVGDETLSYHNLFKTINNVEIVDDLHCIIHFNEIDTQFIYNVATGLVGYVAPKAFAELGPEAYFEHPYGCGMYSFVSFDPGSSFVLERDPNYTYWDTSAKTNIDKYTIKVIADDLTKVSALQTGEVQLGIGIPFEQREVILKTPNIHYDEMEGTIALFIGIECGENYIFNDVNARKALAMCLDRDLIASSIYGNAIGMDGLTPKYCNGYTKGEYYKYDLETATQTLSTSDYDGATIRLVAVNSFAKITELSQAMVYMMEAAGFNVELRMIEHSAMNDTRAQGDYDIYISASPFADDCTTFCDMQFVADRGHFELDNEELKAIITDAAATPDEAARAEKMKQATALSAELCGPIQPLVAMTTNIAITDKASGYVMYPDNSLWLMDMVIE